MLCFLFDKCYGFAIVSLTNNCPRKSPQCGCSSVGRAQPCQGWGRRFESGHPLCKRRRHSQVVRQRSAKPPFPGSNPGAASAPLSHLYLRSQCTFEFGSPHALGPVFHLVQEIMAAHGGTLAVESALGCGTTFPMTLSTVDA